jgi:pyruvate/2-oxoglutarate dehydrogenase complex dihydrolipoamide acyltransferase (E2) component
MDTAPEAENYWNQKRSGELSLSELRIQLGNTLMSIFDKIKNALFGTRAAEAAEPAPAQPSVSPSAPPVTQAQNPKVAPVSVTPIARTAPAAPATPAATPAASAGSVDVAAIMDAAVRKHGTELNWRKSIVDMMKALDLDSSLTARKELADEFGYTGDKGDSATMNVWLHTALMRKLAENGGQVPAELMA